MATFNSKTYAPHRANSPDSQSYAGPDNTASSIDTLTLSRVAAKAQGLFRGVTRGEVKKLRNETLDDSTIGISKFQVSTSIPVGMSEANIGARALDFVSTLADVSGGVLVVRPEFLDLLKKQDIHFS